MKVAITGSSGLLGRTLIFQLKTEVPDATILGLDIVPPNKDKFPPFECPHNFAKVDITNPHSIEDAFSSFKPTVLIHLAFIVDPMRDHQLQRKINVGGTQNVLQAAAKFGVKQLLVASSATAYGAWPTNPLPIKEGWPIQASPAYQYAAEKAEIDLYATQFAAAHPSILVSIIRPCIILGPNINNFIGEGLLLPIHIKIWGAHSPLQFVDVEDVAAAVLTIIKAKASGPFNVAPLDYLTDDQMSANSPKPSVTIPYWLLYVIIYIMWFVGASQVRAPPSILEFSYYPWVVQPKRLTEELNFKFKHSSEASLRKWIAVMKPKAT